METAPTPPHTQTILADGLYTNEFAALLTEAAKRAGWTILEQRADRIVAQANPASGFGETIEIAIEHDRATVTTLRAEAPETGKSTVDRFITTFNALKSESGTAALSGAFTEAGDLAAADEDPSKPRATTRRFSNFVSMFKPVDGYFVTPILININLLIFIVLVCLGVGFFLPTNYELIKWGANFRPATLEGQWWRLLSCVFLHIGVFHLLLNMYALMYIGRLLEPHLGTIRFLCAYLLSGLFASVISLWWHDLTISAGASGAIFGMYGVFLVLLATTDILEEETRKSLLTSIAIFVGYNLIIGMQAGIDNAAHIGGLIGGLLIGLIYTSFDADQGHSTDLKLAGSVTAGFALISLIICSNLTNDVKLYEEKMKDFVEMEKMAMEVYRQANYLPKENLLYNIKDRGIYYWNENINLVNEADKLNLPDEIHTRNAKIKKYCELRIKVFELLYKAISEDTDRFNGEIRQINEEIERVMRELK